MNSAIIMYTQYTDKIYKEINTADLYFTIIWLYN